MLSKPGPVGFAILRTLQLPRDYQLLVLRHTHVKRWGRASWRKRRRPITGFCSDHYDDEPCDHRCRRVSLTHYYGGLRSRRERREVWVPAASLDVRHRFAVVERGSGLRTFFPRGWGSRFRGFQASLIRILRERFGSRRGVQLSRSSRQSGRDARAFVLVLLLLALVSAVRMAVLEFGHQDLSGASGKRQNPCAALPVVEVSNPGGSWSRGTERRVYEALPRLSTKHWRRTGADVVERVADSAWAARLFAEEVAAFNLRAYNDFLGAW